MHSYQAVFCDIDGTLLTSDHRITADTKEKIRQLHHSGIPFILVSARIPAAIYPIQEELGIRAPMISYGGALVLDENRQPVLDLGLSQSLLPALQKALPPESPECCFCTYSYDTWIAADKCHPLVRQEAEITGVPAAGGSVFELLAPDAPIHKLLGFGPCSLLDDTAVRLKKQFPQCAVYKSAPHLLEIMDGQASKSGAIHSLCEKLGISPQDTVSFGDNYNDMDMLRATGHSVAMGNAPAEIKASAREITADNDHEGLLQALNRLFS